MHLLISHFNHFPVIFVSGREPITIGIDFPKETIMKTKIPLNKFPSSSYPTKSPLRYCKDFCQYISSMIETLSLGTTCFSRSNLATFSKSTSPDVNFLKMPNKGSGSSFRKSLYIWYELYRNINENSIKILGHLDRLGVYNIECSFKIKLHSSPLCFT